MECYTCNFSKCVCIKEPDKLNINEKSESYSKQSISSSRIDTKSFTCSKCDISFKNKQTLNIHQATSDKCSKTSETGDLSKICNFCNTEFSSKQMKKYHETKCRDKIIFELTNEYEKKIQDLHKYYSNIISNMKSS